MASHDNKYTPIEHSTPTKAAQMESPISTPTRAALLKPNFLVRGSPIKFTLSTPEKATLRDIDFDVFEKAEEKRYWVRRTILFVTLWAVRIVLIALAAYLSVEYVQSASLSIYRWNNQIKNLYRFALAFTTLAAGFIIAYLFMRISNLPSTPWRGTLDKPWKLAGQWLMFILFLVFFPVGCTITPFLLGNSGQFNKANIAWMNACSDNQFTSMFHIQYLNTFGSPYTINVYARNPFGQYYYLGLLPTSGNPGDSDITFSTPGYILFPSISPVNQATKAAQSTFTLTTNDYTIQLSQMIATLQMNSTNSGTHSILGQCTTSTNAKEASLYTCINGYLRAGTGIPMGPMGGNPFLRSGNQTLEVMYDILPAETNSTNSTILHGYIGTWPGQNTSFMEGDIAADQSPSGQLEMSDSLGSVLAVDGVQIVNSPWPGCQGLKVCSTSGVNGMIAAAWIWENLEQWMWYSKADCH